MRSFEVRNLEVPADADEFLIEVTASLEWVDNYMIHAAIQDGRENWGREAIFFVTEPKMYFGLIFSIYDTNKWMDGFPADWPLMDLDTQYKVHLENNESSTQTITLKVPFRLLQSYSSHTHSHPNIHIDDLLKYGRIQGL